MDKSINRDLWMGRTGLGLIFCYCLLASIFFSYFAQMHLSLSFLPFPIFVGEIVMFLCIPLLAGVCKDGQLLPPGPRILLGLYFGWVLIKALINYSHDGPLSFRNAALFYYPIFAVFAYCFYQKARIPRGVLMSLALLAAAILFFKMINIWYWWTYVTLVVIAVWNTKSVKWRRLGWIFLAAIVFLGKEYFYRGPRAHFVGILFSLLFLVFYFGILFVKRQDFVRLSILLLILVFLISGYAIFSERNSVISLISFKRMAETYQAFDRRLQENQANYVPANLPVQLYHPKGFISPFSNRTSGTDHGQNPVRQERSLEVDEIDTVFRLFIWRDMARELIQQRAWWGFSFGHPQRSRSLEALGWAKTEWGRDGWITPHNSFFHIIYRAGILGIFLIGVLLLMIYRLVADFFNLNSVVGGLLVGILVYWMVLSNFFVILEFPYNAIVFWSLFGIAMAYRDGLKKQ